jgi:hypothetical protein
MASLPFLDYTQLTAIASDGGYSRHVKLTERTNLLILSGLAVLSYRWLWETKLHPISDATYQNILDIIATAEDEIMSNFSVGSIFASVADAADDSTLLLDGTSVLQSDYPELAIVVPSTWLFGLDILLPDMTSKGLFGVDIPANVGAFVGENEHTLTEAEMPAHNHTQNPHQHSEVIPSVVPTAAGLEPALASLVTPTPSLTGVATATNNPSGGGNAHNNVQHSLQVNYYIIAR